jgi:hypothetical protein
VPCPLNARAEKYDLEKSLAGARCVHTVGIAQENLSSREAIADAQLRGLMPNLSMNAYGGHSWAGPTTGVVFDSQGRAIAPRGFDYEIYSFSLKQPGQPVRLGANLRMSPAPTHC